MIIMLIRLIARIRHWLITSCLNSINNNKTINPTCKTEAVLTPTFPYLRILQVSISTTIPLAYLLLLIINSLLIFWHRYIINLHFHTHLQLPLSNLLINLKINNLNNINIHIINTLNHWSLLLRLLPLIGPKEIIQILMPIITTSITIYLLIKQIRTNTTMQITLIIIMLVITQTTEVGPLHPHY